jgi:hypothetical protein
MATMAIGIPPYARITRTEAPPNSAPQMKPKTLGFGIHPSPTWDNVGPLLRFSHDLRVFGFVSASPSHATALCRHGEPNDDRRQCISAIIIATAGAG